MGRPRKMNGGKGVLGRIAARRRKKVRNILEKNDSSTSEKNWEENDCDKTFPTTNKNEDDT